MRLLKTILEKAQSLPAHDIHLHAFKVVYRFGKKTVHVDIIEKNLWYQLLEAVKFHSHYRYELNDKFQDREFNYENTILRAAFSPGRDPIIVLRVHVQLVDHRLNPKLKNLLTQWLQHPTLLLIAGPVKSGKTTLYYKILHELQRSSKTLLSLEDPIEQPWQDLPQLNHRTTADSQNVLQGLLRFDLDIIGLGESRSLEELNMLCWLSLSGINTIATFHANCLLTLSAKLNMLNPEEKARFDERHYATLLLKNIGEDIEIIYANEL